MMSQLVTAQVSFLVWGDSTLGTFVFSLTLAKANQKQGESLYHHDLLFFL